MANRPLCVALVGYGFAGRVFHAPLITNVEGLTLSTIVSSNAAKVHADFPSVAVVAQAATAFADPSIDLVVIATPNDTHFLLARAALAAGKHVVVDKPFTLTGSEARVLAGEAQRAGRVLSVYHNRRWDSDFLTLRRLIDEGELGDVVHFESHFDRWRPDVGQRWREQPGAGSGIWFDLGPHLVDQALCLFGAPRAVFADLAVQREGGRTTDYFHVLLRYDERRVILHGGLLVAAKGPRFIVHGTRGSFVKDGMDSQEDALRAGLSPRSENFGTDPRDGILTLGNQTSRPVASLRGAYIRYYELLRDAIEASAPPPVTAAEAIAVMDILELAEESNRTRTELPFAL
jgi:predicted dehydrogenase